VVLRIVVGLVLTVVALGWPGREGLGKGQAGSGGGGVGGLEGGAAGY
jgi:hypothetical protein